uniref:CDT1 domain-containing protein n=1 Tax=Trichuris muris TaxID=70415 RepID=A0A5S6Q9B9_TRIMR
MTTTPESFQKKITDFFTTVRYAPLYSPASKRRKPNITIAYFDQPFSSPKKAALPADGAVVDRSTGRESAPEAGKPKSNASEASKELGGCGTHQQKEAGINAVATGGRSSRRRLLDSFIQDSSPSFLVTGRNPLFRNGVTSESARKTSEPIIIGSSGSIGASARQQLSNVLKNADTQKIKSSIARFDAAKKRLAAVRKRQQMMEPPKVALTPEKKALVSLDPLADVVSNDVDYLLPHHYLDLLSKFRIMDLYSAMVALRNQKPRFNRMQEFVERILEKKLELKHVGQIMAVYPQSYRFEIDKTDMSNTEPYDDFAVSLFIVPNLTDDLVEVKEPECNCKCTYHREEKKPSSGPVKIFMPLSPFKRSPELKSPGKVVQICSYPLNPFRQRMRAEMFRQNLQRRVRLEHRKFLLNLDPSVKLSDFDEVKLKRWHPQFSLEEVPEIESVELPPVESDEDLLWGSEAIERILDAPKELPDKVVSAVEKVVKRGDGKAKEQSSGSFQLRNRNMKEEIKKLPLMVLQKIKQKADARNKRMFASDEQIALEKQKTRLFDVANLLKYIYGGEGKTCLRKSFVMHEVQTCYPKLSYTEVEQLILLLCSTVPEWIGIHKFPLSGEFVKIESWQYDDNVLAKLKTVVREATDMLQNNDA